MFLYLIVANSSIEGELKVQCEQEGLDSYGCMHNWPQKSLQLGVIQRRKENACWLSECFCWAVRKTSIYLGTMQINL